VRVPKAKPNQFTKLLHGEPAHAVLTIAHRIAETKGVTWVASWDYILKAIVKYPALAPKINNPAVNLKSIDTALDAWISKYLEGYQNRISKRAPSMPGTVADAAINLILSTRFSHLSEEKIAQIVFGHRLAMSAENILGLMLEEYIAERLSPNGWHMCWGETVKSVDFVHEDGRLLQVKNRNNSENSSSGAIRKGTTIDKWYRTNAQSGCARWEKLIEITGARSLSEADFSSFIRTLLAANPEALVIEPANPWGKK
jgi:hypothetical protein